MKNVKDKLIKKNKKKKHPLTIELGFDAADYDDNRFNYFGVHLRFHYADTVEPVSEYFYQKDYIGIGDLVISMMNFISHEVAIKCKEHKLVKNTRLVYVKED